jgi:hypothetical protein
MDCLEGFLNWKTGDASTPVNGHEIRSTCLSRVFGPLNSTVLGVRTVYGVRSMYFHTWALNWRYLLRPALS